MLTNTQGPTGWKVKVDEVLLSQEYGDGHPITSGADRQSQNCALHKRGEEDAAWTHDERVCFDAPVTAPLIDAFLNRCEAKDGGSTEAIEELPRDVAQAPAFPTYVRTLSPKAVLEVPESVTGELEVTVRDCCTEEVDGILAWSVSKVDKRDGHDTRGLVLVAHREQTECTSHSRASEC